jgi:hypothetical protein
MPFIEIVALLSENHTKVTNNFVDKILLFNDKSGGTTYRHYYPVEGLR